MLWSVILFAADQVANGGKNNVSTGAAIAIGLGGALIGAVATGLGGYFGMRGTIQAGRAAARAARGAAAQPLIAAKQQRYAQYVDHKRELYPKLREAATAIAAQTPTIEQQVAYLKGFVAVQWLAYKPLRDYLRDYDLS